MIRLLIFSAALLSPYCAASQKNNEIAFISDTQAPLRLERLIHKTHHNEENTRRLFSKIESIKPMALFISGDVTSFSAREKNWVAMDGYLNDFASAGISVYALLGNHDLMGDAAKGKENFHKRFATVSDTGYSVIVDSIAVLMMNSNISKMSPNDQAIQQQWYTKELKVLNDDASVKFIIVSCHHAPFSNSKAVGSSIPVQKGFVPQFLSAPKCRIFITGHSHAFEHFVHGGKDFIVNGGGGGLQQRLGHKLPDIQTTYKPMFHFLTIKRAGSHLSVESYPMDENGFFGARESILQ